MAKIKRKKRKKFPKGYLFLLLATVISTLGATSLYFYFFQGEELTPIEGASVIPEQALMSAFISTKDRDWSQLKQLGTPEAKKILNNQIEKLPQKILTDNNINYQQDIQPWLGNMMLAFLPSSKNKYDLLAVFGIKNKIKALQFANKLRNNDNHELKIGNYQGFPIIQTYQKEQEYLNYTIINNKLIISTTQKTLELAIDTIKGMPSFKSKNLQENNFLTNTVITVYLPDYLRIIKEEIYDSSLSQKIPSTTIKKLEALNSIVIGVGIEQQGIHLQAIAQIDNQVIKSKFTPQNSNLIDKIPQETVLLLSGSNLNKNWLRLSEQAQEIPEFNYWLSESRDFFEIFNLDLDREIFGWLDGEFAIGITSAEKGIFKSLAGLNIAGVIILNTSDRSTSISTINKIEQLARKTDLIEINTKKNENKIITEWITFSNEQLLSYMWEDEDTLLITLGSPLNTLTNITPNNSLINTEKFQNITANLPALNIGYFYLDMEQFVTILNKFPLIVNQPLPSDINAILNSFQGIALTGTMVNDTTTQVDLIFSLKKQK